MNARDVRDYLQGFGFNLSMYALCKLFDRDFYYLPYFTRKSILRKMGICEFRRKLRTLDNRGGR